MATRDPSRTGAALLVRRLHEHGVRYVFGYPGGPLAPLYDALYHNPAVRHLLPRDEQAAGFMADGYARATGKPGVCIAVCGPGAFNAATPILNAWSDSTPLLLISGQVSSRDPRSGYYHENDQANVFATFTKRQFRVEDPRFMVPELDKAWSAMTEGRPGPVLFDVTGKALWAEGPEGPLPPLPAPAAPMTPRPQDIEALAQKIAGWKKPLLMVGGGIISAGASGELVQFAERLGAPVFNTLMGKCALPSDHPLSVGMPWKESTSDASDMASRISPLFAEADGLLAIGCRFTQVITGSWALRPPQDLAQIDIDPAEFGRHYPCSLGVHADAREALRALLALLPSKPRIPWTSPLPPRPPWRIGGMDLSGAIRRVLPPDAIVVADVTQLAYRMLVEFPVYQPRTFLHPAGGISMGFGLPAALGARAAFPERVIVTVMGDGCFQMTGMELATAVQEKLPVVVILVNDGSLTLIKAIQARRYQGRFLGVDILNPDFQILAKAFSVPSWRVDSEVSFETALREAIARKEPTLVEVCVGDALK